MENRLDRLLSAVVIVMPLALWLLYGRSGCIAERELSQGGGWAAPKPEGRISSAEPFFRRDSDSVRIWHGLDSFDVFVYCESARGARIAPYAIKAWSRDEVQVYFDSLPAARCEVFKAEGVRP